METIGIVVLILSMIANSGTYTNEVQDTALQCAQELTEAITIIE